MRHHHTLYFRIYINCKPLRHVGMVEATNEAEALEKAGKSIYRSFWGTDADRALSVENLTAAI